MSQLNCRRLLALIGLLGVSGEAAANAGVPMLFLVMPALGLSFIPIVLIEAAYLAKSLGLGFARCVTTAGLSNVVSTIVGVPLTWIVLVAIQFLFGGGGAFGIDTPMGTILSVTFQAAWLIPYEEKIQWMIPAAGLFLLIPFFFVSWWSEYLVAKKILNDQPTMHLNRSVRNANGITYGLLAIWPFGFWGLNNGMLH